MTELASLVVLGSGCVQSLVLRDATDALHKSWIAKDRFREHLSWITWTPEGAKLGAGTLLAKSVRHDRVRLRALLLVAFGRVYGQSTLRRLEIAESVYKQGDIAKAAMHIALVNLPKFVDRVGAHRLHLAAGLIDSGLLAPLRLLKGYDFEFEAISKYYNQDELRIPRGNPNGGEWTTGDGAIVLIGPAHTGTSSSRAEQVAVLTTNFRYACRAMGLDPVAASDALHALKEAANLSGASQCTFDTDTGDVFHGDEYIGNLHDQ